MIVPTLRLLLLMAGLICFVLSAIGYASPRGGNLQSAGLACWIATFLLL